MMNSLMLNMNGLEVKKLSTLTDDSDGSKKYRRISNRSDGMSSANGMLTHNNTTFNTECVKDGISSKEEIETQFVPIVSQFATVHTSSPLIQNSNARNSNEIVPVMSDVDVLSQENQKLSSIARLCIHLVDRCRTLNKSKQFSEDLTKLGNLIDDFNRNNTRRCSQLPNFNHTGLVFPTSQNTSTITTTTNNLIYIPIQTSSDSGQNLNPQIIQQLISADKMTVNRGKGKGRRQNNTEQVCQQSQQIEQSILFKKLTESGQLITTDLNKDSSSVNTNAFTIPLSINDQNTIFSIVNQIDNSNIENTPNKSNHKVFKCDICMKMFANAYNLNRHMKSHSSFYPFVCIYPGCQKRFNYNYHLKRHVETHTGERPFICTWPDCDQRFNRKYNLNRHLWVHTEHKNKN